MSFSNKTISRKWSDPPTLSDDQRRDRGSDKMRDRRGDRERNRGGNRRRDRGRDRWTNRAEDRGKLRGNVQEGMESRTLQC
jgi:hypothetical protein